MSLVTFMAKFCISETVIITDLKAQSTIVSGSKSSFIGIRSHDSAIYKAELLKSVI